MKLRNKLAAITAAAMLAFTGIGFGAWIFGHEATANETVTPAVTAAVDLTGLTADEATIKLVLGEFIPDGTALIFNPSYIGPVEQPVPAKGNFFLEELAKVGAGAKYQIFGQIGLDHGPEWFAAKITGLSTTFTAPVGQKVVTVQSA